MHVSNDTGTNYYFKNIYKGFSDIIFFSLRKFLSIFTFEFCLKNC